jgi:vacuolar-type H+-ATPase subunit H
MRLMDRKSSGDDGAGAGHLVRLQEYERVIAQRMDEARDEAATIVEAAREAARRTREETERSLAAESERLRAELRADADARRDEILDAAAERVRRLDAIPEARIEEVAHRSFLRLIGREDHA